MNLYSNLTLKDWLVHHCDEEEIGRLFCKALKEGSRMMIVFILTALIERGDIDSSLIKDALREATGEE